MHRVPPDRLGDRIIDSDRVCDAVSSLGAPTVVQEWAQRFHLLSDPTRLALLVCVDRVGPISVSDLAAAIGARDSTVSQALRLLRGCGAVEAHRDGHVIRYVLADRGLSGLLKLVNPSPVLHHETARLAATPESGRSLDACLAEGNAHA
jgi:DNA-binding transcriptional ArsR family regulator